MRPVCSTDGQTYSSECELKRAGCLSRSSIEIAYSGVCGEKGPCSEHQCQYGAICIERFGGAHCECPVCPAEFEPVCGSDGISYGNDCKLRLEACKHRRDITVLYDGPCSKFKLSYLFSYWIASYISFQNKHLLYYITLPRLYFIIKYRC